MKGSVFIKERKDDNILTSAFIVGYLCHHSWANEKESCKEEYKTFGIHFLLGLDSSHKSHHKYLRCMFFSMTTIYIGIRRIQFFYHIINVSSYIPSTTTYYVLI